MSFHNQEPFSINSENADKANISILINPPKT